MYHSFALPCRTAMFCALALCLSAGAQARTIPGQRVQVSAPCLSTLHVVTDNTLSDGVDIPGAWPAGLQSSTAADGTITLTQTDCASGRA